MACQQLAQALQTYIPNEDGLLWLPPEREDNRRHHLFWLPPEKSRMNSWGTWDKFGTSLYDKYWKTQKLQEFNQKLQGEFMDPALLAGLKDKSVKKACGTVPAAAHQKLDMTGQGWNGGIDHGLGKSETVYQPLPPSDASKQQDLIEQGIAKLYAQLGVTAGKFPKPAVDANLEIKKMKEIMAKLQLVLGGKVEPGDSTSAPLSGMGYDYKKEVAALQAEQEQEKLEAQLCQSFQAMQSVQQQLPSAKSWAEADQVGDDMADAFIQAYKNHQSSLPKPNSAAQAEMQQQALLASKHTKVQSEAPPAAMDYTVQVDALRQGFHALADELTGLLGQPLTLNDLWKIIKAALKRLTVARQEHLTLAEEAIFQDLWLKAVNGNILYEHSGLPNPEDEITVSPLSVTKPVFVPGFQKTNTAKDTFDA